MKLRSIALILTLTALIAPSAVSVFGQTAREPQTTREPRSSTQRRTVAARGKLTGGAASHQVVILKTGFGRDSIARLTVETTGPRPGVIWQADDLFAATAITDVRIADLDGDGVPEILGLFSRGHSNDAALRVFHWDRRSRTFGELNVRGDQRATLDARGYRLRGRPGRQRIVVFTRDGNAGDEIEFEVRGSQLVRAGGGAGVIPQGESGIEGQAVISPAHPGPLRQGQQSSKPYQTALVVVNASDGREAARVQTGSDGRFRVSLPPGEYTVGPAPDRQPRKFPRGEEQTVIVQPGKFTNVTISFDSGMR